MGRLPEERGDNMKIEVYVALNLVGCERRGTIEVDDDATDEEIEEMARDWLWDHIDWGFRKP
jgi:hypothetical protein